MSRQVNSLEQLADQANRDSSVLDVALVLVRYRRVVIGVTLAVIGAAAIISLLIPNSYTATERLLPPKQPTSIANVLLGQLGSLATSAADTLGIHDPNDMYVAMLKSDTVGFTLIKQFDLQRVYRAKTETDAFQTLRKHSNIVAGQDSIIIIEVTERDPELAAKIAAGYGDQLRAVMQNLGSSDAAQRRAYYESQLQKAKDELAGAETAMRKTQEATGLIDLNDQAKAIIGMVAELRAKVTATEVELQAMRSYATPQNPDLRRLEQVLAALKAQLQRAEQNEKLGGGNIQVPTGKVPQVGMEFARRYRDVQYYDKLYELVGKQYEIARLDEASTVSTVQELDRARKPEKRSKPRRGLIVLLSSIVGLFLGMASAFACDALERMNADPDKAAKLAYIQRALAPPFRWGKAR